MLGTGFEEALSDGAFRIQNIELYFRFVGEQLEAVYESRKEVAELLE